MRKAGGPTVVLLTSAPDWCGSCVSLLHVARGLAQHGIGVHIAAASADVAQEFWLARQPVTQLRRGPSSLLHARQLMANERATGILVEGVVDAEFAAMATWGLSIPLVMRCSAITGASAGRFSVVGRLALRRADCRLVFVSRAAREAMVPHARFLAVRPAETIRDGVDTRVFQKSEDAASSFREVCALGDEVFLLCVGTLTQEKRYPLLLQALSRMGSAAPLLLVCGDGPEHPRLARIADALALRVRFLGRLPDYALVGAYSAAAAFVVMSKTGTHGLALLEAMACACPVIASRGGIHDEIIGPDGEYGVLYPPEARGGIAEAIQQIVSRPAEVTRLGTAGARLVRANYSLPAMQQAYAVVFRLALMYSNRDGGD